MKLSERIKLVECFRDKATELMDNDKICISDFYTCCVIIDAARTLFGVNIVPRTDDANKKVARRIIRASITTEWDRIATKAFKGFRAMVHDKTPGVLDEFTPKNAFISCVVDSTKMNVEGEHYSPDLYRIIRRFWLGYVIDATNSTLDELLKLNEGGFDVDFS